MPRHYFYFDEEIFLDDKDGELLVDDAVGV
jgi:hypothetical protein